MSRFKFSLSYSVVFVSRPAHWIPHRRLDCPPDFSIVGMMLPDVKANLAKAAARAYNRDPEPGRWAVLKVSLSLPSLVRL